MAAAVVAARGLFAEATLPTTDGSKITFLDKPYPLGLNDPTVLALQELQSQIEAREIEILISIGSGEVATGDVGNLLGLAKLPAPFFRTCMFRRRQNVEQYVPEMELAKNDPEVRAFSDPLLPWVVAARRER